MSNSTPAPVHKPVKPTGAVKASSALWMLSFLFGVIAIVFAFLSRNTQVKELDALITDLDPKQDASTIETVTAIVFWSAIAAIALVVLIEFLLMRRMLNGHGGMRWVLLVMLVFHAAVMLFGDAFIAFGGEGIYISSLLVAQLVLAGAGLIASLLPGAGAWFRSKNESNAPPVV